MPSCRRPGAWLWSKRWLHRTASRAEVPRMRRPRHALPEAAGQGADVGPGGRRGRATGPGPVAGRGGNAAAAFAATTTVRPGDTLSAIALRYHTTVAALAAANNIADPNRILAGATIEVPAPAPAAAVAPVAATTPPLAAADSPAADHRGGAGGRHVERDRTPQPHDGGRPHGRQRHRRPRPGAGGSTAEGAGGRTASGLGPGRPTARLAARPPRPRGTAPGLLERGRRVCRWRRASSKRCAGGNRAGSRRRRRPRVPSGCANWSRPP